MNGTVLANWPIALVILLIIVGVPLWLTFRRRHLGPDYREARTHYRAKEDPGTPATMSDHVPGERVTAVQGLTVPQSPLADPEDPAGQPRDAGPGGHTGTSQSSDRR